MKKFLISLLVWMALLFSTTVHSQNIQEKLSEFFFDLPFWVDIDVIRTTLNSDPNFKFFRDPNRDSTKTIIGTFKTNPRLDSLVSANQVVIQYSSNAPKKNKKVSLKWTMNYRLEDLASAFVQYDKLKSDFKPLFKDAHEIKKIGEQREVLHSLILKKDNIVVTISLTQYSNFSHTVSLEYRDTWRIEQVNIIKLKY